MALAGGSRSTAGSTQDVPAPGDLPVFDPGPLQQLRGRDGQDGPLVGRLVALFHEHGPRHVEDLRQAAQAGDGRRFHIAAHTLKSNAAIVGLLRLARTCQDAEAASRTAMPPAGAGRDEREAWSGTLDRAELTAWAARIAEAYAAGVLALDAAEPAAG
jgi:HPt (histidine-containing phosphotransfer) domain-containing protein